MRIEPKQSFIVREECKKAAENNGFRMIDGESEGWASFRSTTAPSTIYLAAGGESGPWLLALEHRGVIAELDIPTVKIPGPGLSRYAFATLRDLHNTLSHIYDLAIILPSEIHITHPSQSATSSPELILQKFREKTNGLPNSTEAERLVIQRIGQGLFRSCLMEYWQNRCPLTQITDIQLLRASHIVPWKDCTSDAERLDVHNGLLLSALWDAAFDRGLATFNEEGEPQFSPRLSKQAQENLCWSAPIPLTKNHQERLAWHRAEIFLQTGEK